MMAICKVQRSVVRFVVCTLLVSCDFVCLFGLQVLFVYLSDAGADNQPCEGQWKTKKLLMNLKNLLNRACEEQKVAAEIEIFDELDEISFAKILNAIHSRVENGDYNGVIVMIDCHGVVDESGNRFFILTKGGNDCYYPAEVVYDCCSVSRVDGSLFFSSRLARDAQRLKFQTNVVRLTTV